MAPVVQRLDLHRYRAFIVEFRRNLGIGGPPAAPDGVILELPNGRALLFKARDLYLTQVRTIAGGAWVLLARPNYAQMGIDPTDKFNGPNIANAVEKAALTGSVDLARILLATAEAARSQVIYQICQKLLQSSEMVVFWSELKPMLNNWGTYTNDNNKRRPIAYGALGTRDYYPEQNKDIDTVFRAFEERGLLQDR